MEKLLTTLIKLNIIFCIVMLYFTVGDIDFGVYLLCSGLMMFAFIGIYNAMIERPCIELTESEKRIILDEFHLKNRFLNQLSYILLLVGGAIVFFDYPNGSGVFGAVVALPGLILFFRRSCPFCGFAVIPGGKACAWCHNKLEHKNT